MSTKRGRGDGWFIKLICWAYGEGEDPGPPPPQYVEPIAALLADGDEYDALAARYEALETIFLTSGGTEHEWNRLGIRAEQALSTATKGKYTRSQVLDLVEAGMNA